jgi:hypothetical protein
MMPGQDNNHSSSSSSSSRSHGSNFIIWTARINFIAASSTTASYVVLSCRMQRDTPMHNIILTEGPEATVAGIQKP